MAITIIACRNPQWHTMKDADDKPVIKADGTNLKVINCEAKWSHLGDESQPWCEFTADEFDTMEHGRALYAALINGDYGDIAAE